MDFCSTTIKKLKAGDKETFANFYHLTSERLYGAILQICRDEALAQDLLHDTYIDVYENLSSFTLGDNIIAWLRRIAFNNTFNLLKRRNKFESIKLEIANTDLHKGFTPGTSQLSLDTKFIAELLAELTTEQRFVIWLYVVEQYTHDEIAALTCRSVSYSKSIVSRALSKIRIRKEEQYENVL